jgi:hypothetical protein
MSDPRLQRLTSAENTMIGLATGAIDVSTTQWVLYCKNASQQGLPLTMNPRILYRGYTMSLTNMCVLSGLQFPLTAIATGIFTGGKQRKLSDSEEIGSAFIGGVLSGFICAPMELVMIQQQRYGTSLFSTPSKIIGDAGIGALFGRGLAMSCGREGVFTAGMLGLGPTLRRQAEEAGCGQCENHHDLHAIDATPARRRICTQVLEAPGRHGRRFGGRRHRRVPLAPDGHDQDVPAGRRHPKDVPGCA